jgi:hypothetical protein
MKMATKKVLKVVAEAPKLKPEVAAAVDAEVLARMEELKAECAELGIELTGSENLDDLEALIDAAEVDELDESPVDEVLAEKRNVEAAKSALQDALTTTETKTVMTTATSLNVAAVEATVEESMVELDGLVQQYKQAQNLMNVIREKLKPIARDYNEEMKEAKARKLASFSEAEKTQIYAAVLESCGLEVLANVYVGLLELDEYGVDDGEISTPWPESFAQWCKSEGMTTEVSLFAETVKAAKYEYLRVKCQQNQKALGSVQAVVMSLFRAGKSSQKAATVSSGDAPEYFAETFVKIPGYESAEKGLRVSKKTKDDKFTPKGASTFNYLTKTLGLAKDSDEYKEAEEALETVLKELNA